MMAKQKTMFGLFAGRPCYDADAFWRGNDPFRVTDEAAFYARRFPWSALADAAACFGAVPPDVAAPPALPDPAHHDDWPNAIHWYGALKERQRAARAAGGGAAPAPAYATITDRQCECGVAALFVAAVHAHRDACDGASEPPDAPPLRFRFASAAGRARFALLSQMVDVGSDLIHTTTTRDLAALVFGWYARMRGLDDAPADPCPLRKRRAPLGPPRGGGAGGGGGGGGAPGGSGPAAIPGAAGPPHPGVPSPASVRTAYERWKGDGGLKTPSEEFDWVDVWLDIGHLYHTRGTDEDVRKLLTHVRATAPESNPGNSGEHPAKKFMDSITELNQNIEKEAPVPVAITNFMLAIERCEWFLAQAVRIYVRAEDDANKAQLATLFDHLAAVHARVNELHRRALYPGYPDTKEAQWEWWLGQLRAESSNVGIGGRFQKKVYYDRTQLAIALTEADGVRASHPPMESGFFKKLQVINDEIRGHLTPYYVHADYHIADMFRNILNAEAPWNDQTKKQMATARTALQTYVIHKFEERMPETPTAVTAEELRLYRWLQRAETAERKQTPGMSEVAGPIPHRPQSDLDVHSLPKTGTTVKPTPTPMPAPTTTSQKSKETPLNEILSNQHPLTYEENVGRLLAGCKQRIEKMSSESGTGAEEKHVAFQEFCRLWVLALDSHFEPMNTSTKTGTRMQAAWEAMLNVLTENARRTNESEQLTTEAIDHMLKIVPSPFSKKSVPTTDELIHITQQSQRLYELFVRGLQQSNTKILDDIANTAHFRKIRQLAYRHWYWEYHQPSVQSR